MRKGARAAGAGSGMSAVGGDCIGGEDVFIEGGVDIEPALLYSYPDGTVTPTDLLSELQLPLAVKD
jgi:hypothetical protein